MCVCVCVCPMEGQNLRELNTSVVTEYLLVVLSPELSYWTDCPQNSLSYFTNIWELNVKNK